MKYRLIASAVVIAALLVSIEFFTDEPSKPVTQSQPQAGGKKFNF